MRAALALALLVAAAAAPSAGAAARPCRTSDLRLVFAGSQGAAGTMFESLRLSPHRGVSCTLRGYPGVSLLGRHGRTLPVAVGREPGTVATLAFSHARPARFDVRHPSFDPRTTRPCRIHVFFFRVIPPGETSALTVSTGSQSRFFCRASVRVTPVGRHY
ncbi:MAG: hypothetical protein QOF37_2476 [Thermoleophilaceae bacterium]|nr:hypothetical protein [Thermoleophilaceae bacterium]